MMSEIKATNAVHSYLQHVASKTNRQALRSWEINKYATINMDRQQDADSCGIYTAMFADCLTTGIPLSVLTNAFIHRCRERLAHCLLNNKVTPLSDENVGVRLRSTDSSAGTQSSVPNDKDKPADSTYTQTAEESKGEEEEFPWSKYNAAYATEDSHDHNSAESWTNHTNNTSDGNVPWPTLPSLSQYHMLQEDYDWTPEVYTKYISNNLIAHESALYMPPISRSDRDQLQYISTSSADNFLLQSLGITHSNFLDLIRPDTLDHSVLTHLFKLGLKPYNTSVNLVPPAFKLIRERNLQPSRWRQRGHNKDLSSSFHTRHISISVRHVRSLHHRDLELQGPHVRIHRWTNY